MNQPEKRKVTLEDLLRVKRAECPPPEFWVKFEADMRAKQLSAIVNRPRWSGLAAAFGFLGRYQMPIGAAAAVALTYIGYTHLGSAPPPARAALAAPVVARRILAPAPAEYYRAEKPALAAAKAVEAAPVASAPVGELPRAAAPVPMVASSSSHLVAVPVALGPAVPASRSPFADGFAVTLADYREGLASPRPSTFGSDSEFEVAPARTAAVAEPLARLDPAEERRSRLLDSALPSSRAMVSDWIRARASSDDRMAESLEHASDHLLTGIRF